MTSEEREKMEFLCQQITEERDPDRFDELVFALNELLDAKQQRSTPAQR
jgi:phage terminase large subunit-like protein